MPDGVVDRSAQAHLRCVPGGHRVGKHPKKRRLALAHAVHGAAKRAFLGCELSRQVFLLLAAPAKPAVERVAGGTTKHAGCECHCGVSVVPEMAEGKRLDGLVNEPC